MPSTSTTTTTTAARTSSATIAALVVFTLSAVAASVASVASAASAAAAASSGDANSSSPSSSSSPDAIAAAAAAALAHDGVSSSSNPAAFPLHMLEPSSLAAAAASLVIAYVALPPLVSGIFILAAFISSSYAVANFSGNYSQVDRIWSITPIFYAVNYLVVALARGYPLDARLTVMAALVTAWGVRLTANFARKGGYNWHDQDYRWPYLRTQTFFSKSRIAWELFSLAFIHIYQNLLLFLTTLPTHVAFAALQASATSGATATTWTVYDTAAAAGFLAFLALESVADEQQWAFQSAKHAHLSRGTPLRDLPVTKPHPSLRYGFHTAGLFRYSRHPNFVGEFCIWWAYYGFSVGATASAASAAAAAVPWPAGLLNWTVVGTVLLTLLFQGSTAFTEYISVRKYPLYKVYQRHVPALIPWWPTRVDALERELKQAFDAAGEEDGQKKKVAATSKKSK